jgi:ABC-type Fe3+ transport system permease subunit
MIFSLLASLALSIFFFWVASTDKNSRAALAGVILLAAFLVIWAIASATEALEKQLARRFPRTGREKMMASYENHKEEYEKQDKHREDEEA